MSITNYEEYGLKLCSDDEAETMNMYANDAKGLGLSRVKRMVVVTGDFFEEVWSLLACLQLMADGYYLAPDKKDFLGANLYLKQELIERGFDDYTKTAEQLRLVEDSLGGK